MVIFITGIGTDIGKSWATGWLATEFLREGKSVITQKFIQTGNHDMSEDIILHRRIMGMPLQNPDRLRITCPVILSYPASPHYAARLDGTRIDTGIIADATKALSRQYDVVLVEGAGGIMVPVTEDYLTIDYIAEQHLPVVLVTNGRLGSISDTLLALEAIARRNIELYAVVYNPHFDADPELAAESREYMRRRVESHFPDARWLDMPEHIDILPEDSL
ncbi:MAG: dethiobiotin synthase [Muribaculaceae bacterium]|nr:dethiobiotin synthase [Muribaculaceae bacterium]MDE7343333.1 dethiobiotin synthase [Muribaculaceae bacterium]